MATQGYQEYQNYQNHQSSPNHTHSQQGGGSQQQVPPSMQQHYDPYGMNVENYYQGYHGYQGANNYHGGYGGVGYYDPSVYQNYYANYYHSNSYELGGVSSNENSFLPSDCTDCIFISGLPNTINKKDLISAFSTIGKIKIAKGTQRVFLFLDRKTKEPTGDATITFQSAETAQKAIDTFDETDFNGCGVIQVKIATPEQKNPFAEMLRRQSEANAYASSYGNYNVRGYQTNKHMIGHYGAYNNQNRRYSQNGRSRHQYRSRGNGPRNGSRSLRQNSTEKGDSLSSGGSSSPVSLEHQKSDEALSIHSEKEITDDITARTSELTIQQ